MDKNNVTDYYAMTLYRWAEEYFMTAQMIFNKDLLAKSQSFAAKYNNLCIAYELTIKSYIAFNRSFLNFINADQIIHKFDHDIVKLTESVLDAAKLDKLVNFEIGDEQLIAIKYVNKYYTKQYFRYPPKDNDNFSIEDRKLAESIEVIRNLTGLLLRIIKYEANAFTYTRLL